MMEKASNLVKCCSTKCSPPFFFVYIFFPFLQKTSFGSFLTLYWSFLFQSPFMQCICQSLFTCLHNPRKYYVLLKSGQHWFNSLSGNFVFEIKLCHCLAVVALFKISAWTQKGKESSLLLRHLEWSLPHPLQSALWWCWGEVDESD